MCEALDEAAEHAYAVKALTNPLHEMAGSAAVVFEAGVFEYRDCYVCDGILLQPVYLGSGIRNDLKEAYTRIRAAGRFHTRTAVTSAKQKA